MKFETLRIAQIPNVIGLILYSILAAIGYFTKEVLFIIAGWTLVIFFGWTCFLVSKYGNVTMEPCLITGPLGVACKRIWSIKNKNHVMVYYPVDKRKWQMAAKSPEIYFQTYGIYGHNEKVAAA
jgi:hypothetical protein